MISVEDLTVDYFGNTALNNISIDIPFESSIGIIGPNGAGKSTFIKALLNVVSKSNGTVKIDDDDISKHKKKYCLCSSKK